VKADALRDDLAEDQGQICDRQEHPDDAHGITDGLAYTGIDQQVGNSGSEPGPAKVTGDDANQADANLDGRKKARRFLRKAQRGVSAGLARFRILLQADLARGDDGNFRHGEEPVEANQHKDDEDFEA
jgi:hypothetical protein